MSKQTYEKRLREFRGRIEERLREMQEEAQKRTNDALFVLRLLSGLGYTSHAAKDVLNQALELLPNHYFQADDWQAQKEGDEST